MFRATSIVAAVAMTAIAAPATAQPSGKPSLDYMKSLVRDGEFVFAHEYYDPESGQVVERTGLSSKTPYKPTGNTTFGVSSDLTIRLYGIVPCASSEPIQYADFSGECADLTQHGMDDMLRNAKVVLCRSFISQKGRELQDATCFTYTYFPGALESVDMIEEELVSVGEAFAERDASGELLRPDLAEAERLAKVNDFGLWTMDPVPMPGETE